MVYLIKEHLYGSLEETRGLLQKGPLASCPPIINQPFRLPAEAIPGESPGPSLPLFIPLSHLEAERPCSRVLNPSLNYQRVAARPPLFLNWLLFFLKEFSLGIGGSQGVEALISRFSSPSRLRLASSQPQQPLLLVLRRPLSSCFGCRPPGALALEEPMP